MFSSLIIYVSTILHCKSFKNFFCTGAVESTKDCGKTSSEGVSSREVICIKSRVAASTLDQGRRKQLEPAGAAT